MKKFLCSILFLAVALSAMAERHTDKLLRELRNPKSDYVFVIAHRADWRNFPENSLEAIESAIQMGVDIVELDVHRTADGELVVCHDKTIDRTTNGKGRIEEMTLAEIQALRLLNHDGTVSNETIPTLEQVLALCKGRCPLLLEIKKKRDDQYPGIEALADSIVKAHGMEKEVVFQSFNDDVLFKLHAIDESLRLEKLLVAKCGNLILDNSFAKFSWEKYDFVASFNIFRLFASKRFIRTMHAHGKEVKVWTINKPNKAPKEADGIISDRPDLFIAK